MKYGIFHMNIINIPRSKSAGYSTHLRIKVWLDISRGAGEESLDRDARDALVFSRNLLEA